MCMYLLHSTYCTYDGTLSVPRLTKFNHGYTPLDGNMKICRTISRSVDVVVHTMATGVRYIYASLLLLLFSVSLLFCSLILDILHPLTHEPLETLTLSLIYLTNA
ncbi:uncharacterized protein BO95DRAFT_216943 [Aspergillus brunneoviolaceus CBS 621.78]|uniref:Uncharacterized protein n=1 Tax=Aspergillus brunneoviolaceus CBS 621.78 TaxID=1450534 RepID=A0ACD1G1E0_9EURO|nr:hypothetical protein BO95DRAFT_216943 [Aspergillus brunneoviolaceus CBS 621.78]RAH43022.1 hypothetical protein BO95DRAFT_216943 [Aspergillus brunneoviolaceus CBS 621.78]